MLFNWIAEELGARALPAPAPHAPPHARAARRLRKSVFQVTDCRAPSPRTPPSPAPRDSPSCLGASSLPSTQMEPEDTRERHNKSPPAAWAHGLPTKDGPHCMMSARTWFFNAETKRHHPYPRPWVIASSGYVCFTGNMHYQDPFLGMVLYK